MKTQLLSIAFIAAILSGCPESGSDSSAPPTADTTAKQKALNDSKALWQSASLSTYQYTYRRSCFCLFEDIVVNVVNGQVASAYRTPSGIYLTPNELSQVFTVEGFFALIQQALDRQAFSVEVRYNTQYGFPESVAIDYSQVIADDEVTHTVRDLH